MDRRTFLACSASGLISGLAGRLAAETIVPKITPKNNSALPLPVNDIESTKFDYLSKLAKKVDDELCVTSLVRTLRCVQFEKLEISELPRYATEESGKWFLIDRDRNGKLILKDHSTWGESEIIIPCIETSTYFKPTFNLQKDFEHLHWQFQTEELNIISMFSDVQIKQLGQIVVYSRCGVTIAYCADDKSSVAWHDTGYGIFV